MHDAGASSAGDRVWRGAVMIASAGGRVSEPAVATDGRGGAFAAWEQVDNGKRQIWGSRFAANASSPTGGWSVAAPISGDAPGNARAPALAMDPTGNVLVLWQNDGGDVSTIWWTRWSTGSWSSPAAIDVDEVGGYAPQLTVDETGRALAVWKRMVPGRYVRYVIVGAGFDPALAGFGPAEVLVSEDTGAASELKLTMSARGDAMLVWRQPEGAQSVICARRFTTSAGWDNAITLAGRDGGQAGDPDVALDDSGRAIAVWSQWDGLRPQIWSSSFAPATGWSNRLRVQDERDGFGTRPRIALSPGGDAIAIWLDGVPGVRRVWASRYSGATALWSLSEPIATAAEGLDPQVAMDAAGNATALWTQTAFNGADAMQSDVVSNGSPAGNEWRMGRRLNPLDSTASEARLAVTPRGDGVAVWSESHLVYAAHFR